MSFDLTPSDELSQILDAAQAMLDRHYPLGRTALPDPVLPLAEFGAFALALPEKDGGAGFSVMEEAHLNVAFGRHLIGPGAVAAAVVARAGPGDISAQVASGAVRVCAGVGLGANVLLFEPEGADVALCRYEDGFHLTPLTFAPTPVPAMGSARPLGRIPRPDQTRAMGPEITRIAQLLTAAQLVGVATCARDLAVDYAQTREQFGRPIGSFQAVKHHAANMALKVEMLSSQLDMAAIALRDGHEDAAFQIAALTRLASRLALDNARLGIQIHGGIGFSDEAPAQLCVKEAHRLGQFLGPDDLMQHKAPLAPKE